MKTVHLTCIGCPMGCNLQVRIVDGTIAAVEGNTCPQGDAYARREVTNPTRLVTTTVKVTASRTGAAVVPCKTAGEVPKAKVLACAQALRGVSVAAPVHIGDVVCRNVADTGVDMVATKEIW